MDKDMKKMNKLLSFDNNANTMKIPTTEKKKHSLFRVKRWMIYENYAWGRGNGN